MGQILTAVDIISSTEPFSS